MIRDDTRGKKGLWTDHSYGLHIAIGEGEETLSGNGHVGGLPGIRVLVLGLELAPEALGGQGGVCGPIVEGEQGGRKRGAGERERGRTQAKEALAT